MAAKKTGGEGFQMAVLTALEKIGGALLFNHRIEDKPRYQRCAAVVVGEPPDQTVVVSMRGTDQFADTILPLIRSIEQTGVTSLRNIALALNARSVRSRRSRPNGRCRTCT